jgi:tryptophanyl-tRNA synthetase
MVTPKEIDYNKLVDNFGCKRIPVEILHRFEKLTGVKPHHFLSRKIFYCHQDLEKILDLYEQKKPFYLYTGRGPSSKSMHLGHLIPFIFTSWLQKVFNVQVVIQITDDEKFYWSNFLLEEIKLMAMENIKDIISIGFNPKKTFIFLNTEYIEKFYPNICKIQKTMTLNLSKKVFGFTDEDHCGKIAFPANQIAPCLSSSFSHLFSTDNVPCLIPSAIDQSPYFRLTRDVVSKLSASKPSLVHSKFLPSLKGNAKMSSSSIDLNSIIFLTDSNKEIKNKINKYAFSGGGKTLEEHREKGGNYEVDVAYQYLSFFLEDDQLLGDIKQKYSSGLMLSGELKAICIDVIQKIVNHHQEERKKITDDVLTQYLKY